MSLLKRIFGSRRDDHANVRALWHRTVAIAREPHWYAQGGIADSVSGRFDTITLVLAAVLLRMEAEPDLAEPSVRLTELFVDDMDGQLREAGIGDLVVGKHIGRLMSVVGGRLGALRAALATEGDEAGAAALADVVARNVTLTETADTAQVAAMLRRLAADLAQTPTPALLAGEIAR